MEGAFEPLADTTYGEDFAFIHVFGEVKKLIPERPINPYYDFYKLIIRSSDRISRTHADCYIPLNFSTSGNMRVGKWQLAVEAVS